MTNSYLLHELGQICAELRSEKVTNRNKSLDKLDNLLANSKDDVMQLYAGSTAKLDPSWKRIFNSSIDAAIDHAKKVQEAEGTKTFQTQRNKNHIYNSIINRLIDYSLEDDSYLLDQSTILTAFKDGYGNVTVRKNFGRLFLQILERGIYDSVENIRGIKASELSSILSYLFEMNNPDDDNLKLAVIRCINKTVELCKQYVQLGLDLRDYFPDAISLANEARDEQQKAEAIKLFYLLTSELLIDYHITVCGHIQEVLPTLCEYYNSQMRIETKTFFFLGVYSSLKAIYPNLNSGDYNPIGVALNENWMRTVVRKLNAIVEVESKEQSIQLQRSSNYKTDELFKVFLKTSAMIVYLMNWADGRNTQEEEEEQPRAKIQRTPDRLETILDKVTLKDKTSINQISLQIFTQLIVTQPHLINEINFIPILESHHHCLSMFNCWQNLKCLRLGFGTLLQLEPKLFPNMQLASENWKQIVEFLIADTCSNTDVLREKHLLLQELIRANKIKLEDCTTLLNFLLINTTMRRNECVSTIREMLLYNENCNLDKTSEIIGKLLSWLYQSNNKIDGKSLLLNVEPLNEKLVADTAALMVINFLDSMPKAESHQVDLPDGDEDDETKLINYKYCRKYICIEEHGKDVRRANGLKAKEKPARCFIQSNYELLMRLLNFETSKKETLHNINMDLSRLLKMVLVLRQFFFYGIFDTNTYLTCPLIKRIGFFIDNLDFQLKSINVQKISKSELLDVIEILLEIFNNICDYNSFFTFLDKQNIEGLINFCGGVLKITENNKSEDSKKLSLNTMKLLATLCFSKIHSKRAFAYIKQQRMILKDNLYGILSLIKIFCKQQQNEEIAVWFGGKLKTMCQLYYSDIELCDKIVQIMPEIVRYVEPFQAELDICLIIISSFLKVTSKKYYSTKLAAKLINSVRQIANYCPNLIDQDNFQVICLMPSKFVSSQSIIISFAAVNTITALLDSKWISIKTTHMEKYFTFASQLYSKLDWNNLPMEKDDIKTNSTAVAVQLLTSLFAFSSFHREVAFQELGNYLGSQSLNESYFYNFRDIAAFFNCSLSALTKPYIDALLHVWTQKKLPIAKFPYFLCEDSQEKCFTTHLSSICYYQLRFSSTQGLEELQRLKYGTARQLLAKAFPICYAYLLSQLSKNSHSPEINYVAQAKGLLNNLNDFGVDLVSSNTKVHWGTIYSATKQLWDEYHYATLFGFTLYANTPSMLMNFTSLKHILRYYLQKCYALPSTKTLGDCFVMLIKNDPMALLRVFAAFKLEFSDFIFLSDRLKSFYWFCSLAEIMIESISEQNSKSGLNSTQTFFLRDILFFILKSLEKGEKEIYKAGLHFLHQVLDKNISSFSDIINKHLNDIACILVSITQNSGPSVDQDMAINLLELLICQHTAKFIDSIKLLDKFPDLDIYQHLRSAVESISDNRDKELRWAVKDFLNTTTKGVEGIRSLKNCIAGEKLKFDNISKSSNLLYDLLKRLIDMVRSSETDIAMESAKCLGEIGSVKIPDISFYFECESTFYSMEFACQDEMTFLVESLYRILDELLLLYDSVSIVDMYAVCKDLASSKIGSRVLVSFPTFGLFLKQGYVSVLDNYKSIDGFNFIDILKKHEDLSYEQFSKAFSSNVFEKCQWDSIAKLCKNSVSFSESAILPFFNLLLANRESHFENILALLEYFFSQTFEFIQNEEWKKSQNVYSDKRVIKYFLNICECIRIHNNWNVPINLLYVAKACIFCQAYFMGILYLEMWALVEKDKEISKNAEIIINPIFQEVATMAFKSIDCPDAISGFLDPLNSRLEYLNLEGDWSQVLMEIDASKDLNQNLYSQSLKKNGLLLLSSSDKFTNRLDYECCWRLGQWDTAVDTNSKIVNLNDLEFEFEKNHFNALKSIFNREEVNCMSAIDKARQAIVSILKEISIECLQNIYKYLTYLQMLQQAEDFCQIQFSNGTQAEPILKKWIIEQELTYGNFNCKELVLSHNMALYKIAGIRAGRRINEFFKDKSPIGECILKCINECKNAGNINLAIRNLTLLRSIDTSEQLKAKALIEDADICWKTGKSRMAKAILHNVMSNKDFVYCLERIQAHRMYGELLLETNNETFEVVHKEFFIRCMELLNKYSEHREKVLKVASFDAKEFETFNIESRKLAFATIAKYADKEYMQLDTYLNSETFRTKVQIMMKNKEEAQSLARQSKERDKSIGINVMLRNCGIDDKEIKMMELKRSENLCIAVENYIQFCKLDKDITSPAVYRIIALWFANKHDQKLHAKIKENINAIPSYKFLCVLNQMSARLSSKNPSFLQLLEEILIKCIQDHPHHTLHKIFALVFAYADDPKNTTSSDRVDIAKNMINKVKNKMHTSCIKQMESMFIALIDFANKESGKSSSLSLSDKVKRLKNLENVQCPTLDLPISVNKSYLLTYIRKWEDHVGLVGGINAPKKLMCVCSDGVSRPQLLKGKDDLRQDAVMQQVLSMVNELLKSDPETNDQKLMLRTYRIVPLSMRSGILEWCDNTVPIGLYLCGDKKNDGAHKKYRPNDYTVAKCRSLSMDALKKQDFNQRLQVYQHICEKIKPVFHYFFFEKFLVPGIWFERRLAYTKSIATTSIVGFILGLGDRHVQNILIDELTAEVIHIDFGIAFEQGKIMPTPETVPFRLTRDIVAPMGISEADGVFRRACEKTMKILRKNQVFLTTILEVLLYDPLYVWKWSSQKNLDTDKDGDSEGKNLTAQRALLRVQDKLEGKEEGKMGTPNVEVQIQRLINEAMNVHNLCRLYPGWDPYL
ncbi:serine/threonine-protein kinase ATM [Eupeodes corollae]|uniref:serine/threonine-protein kinase ATM n=1 Tax=Eupeodes corollae TaxID=290404 RepID=UPI0024906B84|nr:serine/threonine-protein kinase ATM [Eupeodes corollae]